MSEDIEDNPAIRSFAVCIVRPKSNIKHYADKTNPADQLLQDEIEALDFTGKKVTIHHDLSTPDATGIAQEASVAGKIVKCVPDSQGNLVALHYNYGNKHGICTSYNIKKGNTPDVSATIKYDINDMGIDKYEAVGVSYLKEGRQPGTSILYACGPDYEYHRPGYLLTDPIIFNLINDAKSLNEVAKKSMAIPILSSENTKKQESDSTNNWVVEENSTAPAVISDFPEDHKMSDAAKTPASSTPEPAKQPAAPAEGQAGQTQAQQQTPPADTEMKDAPATAPTNTSPASPLLQPAEYEKLDKELKEALDLIQKNQGNVDKLVFAKALSTLDKLTQHKVALDNSTFAKKESEFTSMVEALTKERDSYKNRLLENTQGRLQEEKKMIMNYLQNTEGGKRALQSFPDFKPDDAAELIDYIATSAPPNIQEKFGRFNAVLVDSGKSFALEAERRGAEANSYKEQAFQHELANIGKIYQRRLFEPYPTSTPKQQQTASRSTIPPASQRFAAPPSQPSSNSNAPATPGLDAIGNFLNSMSMIPTRDQSASAPSGPAS